MIKRILLWSVLILVLIQFIPVDRTNPPVKQEQDFLVAENAPAEVRTLLRNACYDCHSNETKYPKYAYVAPISWIIKDHVNEGREHGNFSIWTTYNKDIQEHFMEEAAEEIEKGGMPLKSYTPWHEEANLNAAQKDVLINYFRSVRAKVMSPQVR